MPNQPKHMPYPLEEHDARLMCADPKAVSYEWINRYADNLGSRKDFDEDDDNDFYGDQSVTIDELIDTAMTNIDGGGRWGNDYISKGGLLEGEYVDPTFWDKLAILKDIQIPSEKRNNFFSCSC